jgi:uncharacterized protein (TIGR03032 family)
MNTKPLPPFSCTYSPNVPELLRQLNITLAISTYQAGKVIFISAVDDENLIQLPRNFKKAMGMAFKPGKMAIAVQDEVIVLANSEQMARTYPPKPNVYDALYLPRATYYTGHVDLHDLDWEGEDLWAVNTRFSCLARITDNFSFEPVWKPDFITELVPEDRCHLNGVAFKKGKPKYVSALGKTNSKEGWRPGKANGGIIIDVESNKVICENLAMPHSPRVYGEELYFLLSADGQLVKLDQKKESYEIMHSFDGYVRGMSKYDDYLFVGLSKIRKKSSSFGDLPIAEKSVKCGIDILHFPTMSKVAQIQYQTSVEELYDVKILEGMSRPNVLSTLKEDFRKALVIPEGTYWAKENNQETNN